MNKKIIKILILTFALNFICVLLLKKDPFISVIKDKNIDKIFQKPIDNLKIILISENYLKKDSSKIIKYFNKKEFNKINIIYGNDEKLIDKGRENYIILLKKTTPFYFKSTEYIFRNHDNKPFKNSTYYHVWESHYVWFFYKWVLVKKKWVGNS